jgi:hypothetical protein
MELSERLSQRIDPRLDPFSEPFSEIKNRVHMALIEALGRQLFNTEIDPDMLRVRADRQGVG